MGNPQTYDVNPTRNDEATGILAKEIRPQSCVKLLGCFMLLPFACLFICLVAIFLTDRLTARTVEGYIVNSDFASTSVNGQVAPTYYVQFAIDDSDDIAIFTNSYSVGYFIFNPFGLQPLIDNAELENLHVRLTITGIELGFIHPNIVAIEIIP